ncbi:CHASE2 domain-containing protein [Cupriavidus sp. USMAA2-4]|uniref:CHASE2 domain-containing protein n=1 Tax=Cupriavidus sp. USMAA2-4 TaxID=876364 RepID=UPI000A80B182|nr:CHASE2 domain-containing protein [Cupriavidus sp. USMAA2-4]
MDNSRPGTSPGGLRGALAAYLAPYRRRTLLDWWLLSAAVAVLAIAAAHWQWTQRADLAVYDIGIAAQAHAPQPDIMIVAIDDASITSIGRWPWRRAVLADLIDHIAAGKPRVIGLDIILSEPDLRSPGDDMALARSMARAGNVVLPALAEAVGGSWTIRYPLPWLGAAGIGHIDMAVDVDGVARQVFLQEGLPGALLTHFSAVIAGFGRSARPVADYRHENAPDPFRADGDWQRRYLVRIPFAGPPGTFPRVSVRDVLSGAVPPEVFRGKAVLVGAAATGLGDVFPTPVSRDGRGMSGVEILTNTIQALEQGSTIVAVAAPWFWLGTLLPILLAALAALMLAPRAALLISVLLAGAAFAASLLLMGLAHLWFAPASAIVGCLLFYPLWSWRRQEAVLRFLAQEAARLEAEPGLLGASPPRGPAGRSLDHRMEAVYRMSSRLRDLRQFLSDALESLPEATVICTPEGRVLLANRRCAMLCAAAGGRSAGEGETGVPADVHELLTRLFPVAGPGLAYWEGLHAALSTGEGSQGEVEEGGVELSSGDERPFLLRGAALRSSNGGLAGVIVSLIDISEVRRAERQREQTLRFLSHDMRSPQASILALLELQADAAKALPQPALLARIGGLARRTLDLADDFIRLARAETQPLRLLESDLAGLVLDATDALWAQASARRIELALDICEEACVMMAEPALLARAVANLVGNAIKFSPDGGTVAVSLAREAGTYAIRVSDQGPGIAVEDQARLFRPFSRLHEGEHGTPGGVGLGLVFVRTVVQRHGGTMAVESERGAGATFIMRLPAPPESGQRPASGG